MKEEMRKIQRNYKQGNMFCCELYTLMSLFAMKNNYKYNMDIHSKLLNID